MTIDLNDPRLTAYALGELTEAERGEVETALAESPGAREAVDEIRATAESLSSALRSEPLPRLAIDQRAAITATQPASETSLFRFGRTFVGIAASLMFVGFVGWLAFGSIYSRPLTVQVMKEMEIERRKNAQKNSTPPTEAAVAERPPATTGIDQIGREATRLAEAKLKKIAYQFEINDMPLEMVVRNLRDASGVAIVVQWPALEQAGIEKEKAVSINGSDATYESVLRSILERLSNEAGTQLAYDISDGVLTITTMEALSVVRPNASLPTSQPTEASRLVMLHKFERDAESPKFTNTASIVGQPTADALVAPVDATHDPTADGNRYLAGSQVATAPDGNSNESPTPWHVDLLYPKNWSEIRAARQATDDTASASAAEPQQQWHTTAGDNVTMPGFGGGLGGGGGGLDADADGTLDYSVDQSGIPQSRRGYGYMTERRARRDGTESYTPVVDNPFLTATQNPLSTFSIDVDTASYANVRRFLNAGQLPPPVAVRIEELLNYFSYDYPPPAGGDEAAPFSANMEIAECPWTPSHRLVRIGLKGRTIASDRRPKSNLVFLIDVSGSMDEPNKLPLVKRAMQMLTSQLGENDRVAMVVYAGSSGLVLPSTTADHTQAIMNAIENLSAGGSTNGGEGINLAYDIAQQYFVKGGVNRVILCTDGDFNVGVTSPGDLTRLIEEKAKSGVFLSVFGFGMGNLKDSTLESLADKGNGNYGYIDTLNEARKVFVEQLSGTLVTIAKDVKIQVEFNPARVAAYRLIGYENRLLRAEDFNNDQKDAGEIGAGHTVTALYELVPVGQPIASGVDPLKYQQPPAVAAAATGSNESLTLKLRYKQPDGETSKLLEFPATDSGKGFAQASPDFQFAAAVAGFGMQLRNSPHKGNWTLNAVREVAQQNRGADPFGYRAEFIELAGKARGLVAR